MATLTTTPDFPIPGQVLAKLGLDESGTNLARGWVTSAPPGSELRTKLEEADAGRVEVFAENGGENISFLLDKGGVYTFAVQEYTLGATSYGGSYEGDPDGYPSETKVGSEYTVTISVGSRLTSRVGSQSTGSAVLVLWVWGDNIRATTRAVHGEKSPALINPSNDVARAAIDDATVKAAVTALVDGQVSAITETDALLGEMRSAMLEHFQNTGGSYHDNADTENLQALQQLPDTPANREGRALMLRTMHRALVQHMRNLKKNGEPEESLDEFHDPTGGNPQPDLENLPVVEPPGGPAQGAAFRAALADLHRAYEAHRVNDTSHTNADNANTLTALKALAQVDRAFADYIRQSSPTVPDTVHAGVALLVNSQGFLEE